MAQTKAARKAAMARKQAAAKAAPRTLQVWDVVWAVKADWNHATPRPHVVVDATDDHVQLMPLTTTVARGPQLGVTRTNGLAKPSYCAVTTTLKGGVEADARYWVPAKAAKKAGRLDEVEQMVMAEEMAARLAAL
jgi:hypothetical protein